MLYVASMAFPAVYAKGFGAPTSNLPGRDLLGYEMLLGLPQAMLAPSWWANPMWCLGLFFYFSNMPRAALVASTCALILAVLVMIIGPFPPDNFEWSHLRFGYYVWLISMIELVIAACLQLFGKPSGLSANL
jgi:hypothetical protein